MSRCIVIADLSRGELHDRLAILQHSQHASLNNVEGITRVTLVDNACLLGHDDLLKDVTQLPTCRVTELLQEWHTA